MDEIRFQTMDYEECKGDLLAFRNANRDTARDEAYFEWRYTKRPSGMKPLILWATDASGNKIGSLSLIPHHYLVDNKRRNIGLLGDVSVAREWRGKGVASRMFNHLTGVNAVRGFEACIVLPNAEAARPLEKAGWQKVSKLERHVKILRSEGALERLSGKTIFTKIAAPILNTVLRLSYGEVFPRAGGGYRGEVIGGFDDRFDELWGSLNKENTVLGMRNMEYLIWRYSMHPDAKYSVFILTHEERLCGYAVFNIHENTCHVADMICLNKNRHPEHLLYYFIKYVRKNVKCGSIILSVNRSDFSGLPLRRFGFIRRPGGQDFMVYFYDKSNARDLLLNGRKWYLTSGDKDV